MEYSRYGICLLYTSGDHIGHQLGGNGVAALGLAVLPGIAEVGDYGGDAAGGSAAARVDHHQRLRRVYRSAHL